MRLITKSLILTAFTSLFITGCNKGCEKNTGQELPPAGLAGTGERPGSINLNHPPGMNPIEQKAWSEAQKNRPILKGKVVEAVYKEGFAYVRLDTGSNTSAWVAIVNQKPTIGQEISVQEQALLTDFHSKSLDRTFDKIVFGTIVP
jgi:hypothetical protein